jgi:hypothetical protein
MKSTPSTATLPAVRHYDVPNDRQGERQMDVLSTAAAWAFGNRATPSDMWLGVLGNPTPR